jgi:hypothetical protein
MQVTEVMKVKIKHGGGLFHRRASTGYGQQQAVGYQMPLAYTPPVMYQQPQMIYQTVAAPSVTYAAPQVPMKSTPQVVAPPQVPMKSTPQR